jgi:NTE family protein
MQQRASTPYPCRSLEKRRIALALQGGGSHGAFTWGVLERLLVEPSLEVVAISGTSAGAMNAGVLADGLRRGGASQARLALRQYWEDVGHLPGYSSLWRLAPHHTWHLDQNPAYLWAG